MLIRNLFRRRPQRLAARPSVTPRHADLSVRDWADLPTYHPQRDAD
jgi:hypothetical protein